MNLHIVSFDIPYPANYGGVIVIYHQIKALHALGVKVILHCYEYGDRHPQPALAAYCHEVYYYPRSRSLWYQLHPLPFIMRTRMSSALLKRLKADNYPILFEGMHTAGLVWHKRLMGRPKIVRMHNVEWQYYESMSSLSEDLPEKIYAFVESIKLQRIEPKVVLHADEIICISTEDAAYYRDMKANTHYIPALHPNAFVESGLGRGEYVLFHGKLSVADNEQAAMWLIKEVFANVNVPFIVAGLKPSWRLREMVERYDHIQLIADPGEEEMNNLIRGAHINVLVSFQRAGMKLKLINSLFRGRFCLVNQRMVSGTGLDSLCLVRNSAAAMRQTVEAMINAPFTQRHIDERRNLLETAYSNVENTQKLLKILQHYDKTAEQ
jgi:Glycosyltransferase Family 4